MPYIDAQCADSAACRHDGQEVLTHKEALKIDAVTAPLCCFLVALQNLCKSSMQSPSVRVQVSEGMVQSNELLFRTQKDVVFIMASLNKGEGAKRHIIDCDAKI